MNIIASAQVLFVHRITNKGHFETTARQFEKLNVKNKDSQLFFGEHRTYCVCYRLQFEKKIV